MASEDHLELALAGERARRRLPGPATCRLIRERAGVSQRTVAKALGVNVAAVCRWESGRNRPSPKHAAAYIDALGRMAREAGLESLLEAGADDGRPA